MYTVKFEIKTYYTFNVVVGFERTTKTRDISTIVGASRK